MAIQNRRGIYKDFDPDKLLPGEWAVVVSGENKTVDGTSIYICFKPGNVKRMATYEDIELNIEEVTQSIQDKLKADVADAINRINTAIVNAKQATTDANAAIETANSTIETAQTVIQGAETATGKANTAAANAAAAATQATQAVTAANQAAARADTAAENAQTATDSANTAAGAANQSAQAADSARGAAQLSAERANLAAANAEVIYEKLKDFNSTEVANDIVDLKQQMLQLQNALLLEL